MASVQDLAAGNMKYYAERVDKISPDDWRLFERIKALPGFDCDAAAVRVHIPSLHTRWLMLSALLV